MRIFLGMEYIPRQNNYKVPEILDIYFFAKNTTGQ